MAGDERSLGDNQRPASNPRQIVGTQPLAGELRTGGSFLRIVCEHHALTVTP
jgi:hypothetical protein